MGKIFLFILAFFVSLALISQDYGSAIILNSDEISDELTRSIIDDFKSSFDKKKRGHVEFYSWDGESKSEPNLYSPYKTGKEGEKPILKAVYLKANFSQDSKLKTAYKLDTLDKVEKMLVYYQTDFDPILKIIDLPTSEVDVFYKYDNSEWGVNNKFIVKNFKAYFGSDPRNMEKNNPRLFEINMKKYLKAEGDELKRFYEKKIKSFGERLEEVSNQLKNNNDSKIWRALDYSFDEKGKLEEFYIDAKLSDNLEIGDVINIYVKRMINDFVYYDYVSDVTVKEVTKDKVRVKPFSLMRKKIAEALEGDTDVVFTRNDRLIKELNRGGAPYKRVQVISDCADCFTDLVRRMYRGGSTKLIARNFDGPRQHFAEKYKDEKFLDYNMEDFQGKQQGVDFIFESNVAGISATDVKTGRIAFVASKEKSGIGKILNIDGPSVSNLMMDIMDVDFEIVKILKEKNGKLEKFVAYNPLGFGRTYNIVKVIEEEVGGRPVNREEIIGKCYIGKVYSDTLAEVKVAKGKKELYTALQNGEKIRYRF